MGGAAEYLSKGCLRGAGILIFLIVGSQKFPFERLIREMDRLKGEGVIRDEVIAQIGVCPYEPKHLTWQRFMDKETFDRNIAACDLLVTHAGEGSIMTGLLKGRKVVAVPRYARFGEHLNDHQLMIARAMERLGCLINVEEIEKLGDVLTHIGEYDLKPYVSQQATIIKTICDFIGD